MNNIFIPAARSRTTTLLRLHPSYRFHNERKKEIIKKQTHTKNFSPTPFFLFSNETHFRHVTGGVYKI